MKKLVLSFVLMIAGLVAIAQENDISKKMVRDDYHLCFVQNNEVIPDVELQKLLSEDVYNSYQTGRVLYKVVETGLNKTQARIREQYWINYFGMEKNGGQLYNQINSIAPKYWNNLSIKVEVTNLP